MGSLLSRDTPARGVMPAALAPGPLHVAIVAGEPSGDQIGADLISALRARHPTIEISALAGPRMRAAGCTALASIDELSVMGLVEVLKHYPRLHRLRTRLIRHFLAHRPDVFVGIDVPDFVLRIETSLKQAGVPTVHYVCPQAWAWRESRVAGIKRAADCVLALFPFELPFLARHGIRAHFVGHPLADSIPLEIDRAAARQRLGLAPTGTVVALMPGSRKQELHRHLTLFLATADLLAEQYPDVRFVLGAINQGAADLVNKQRLRSGSTAPIDVVIQQSRDTLMAADVALCVSGTITLEAALAKTPLVVAYQMPALTYRVLRRLVKTPWIALPNILAGYALVPELIQGAATPQTLVSALKQWLSDSAAVAVYRNACLDLHRTLRNNAGAAAATAVLDCAAATRARQY